MKEIVYSFYNTLGDKFYLRLLCEGDMYREIHIDVVDKIKKDIHFGFDKLYFPEKGCHLGTNRSDNET